jgi:hypothetical protein
MLVGQVGRYIPLPHVLEIAEQTIFVFNSSYAGSRPGDENGGYAIADVRVTDFFGYGSGYIY